MSEDARGRRGLRNEELDRRIDLVLRQMTAGEGPPDLRRRVMERVAHAPRPVVSLRMMLAVAATIVLAAATGVVLRRPAVHSPAMTADHRDVPLAAVPPSPPSAPAGSPTPIPSARLVVRPAPRSAARPQPSERLTAAAADAEVAETEPIELAPLAVSPMTDKSIAVTALRIERMQIEPLAEPQP